ncbi:hypothetical protein C8Q76DRAFT_751887 [Earliella scabrosa]|nr:hypothetical protein C8Q76DRAFT_751887 [Earliella scabrosa]
MPRAFDDTPNSDVLVDSSRKDAGFQYQNSVDSLGWFSYRTDGQTPGRFYEDTEDYGTNGCWVTFPFTGNRVAVYGFVKAGKTGASSYRAAKATFSIDGQQRTIYTSTYAAQDRNRVRLYWSDLLPTGDHILTVTVDDQGEDGLVLDWVEYNTTTTSEPFPTSASSPLSETSTSSATTSGSPTTSSTPSPSSASASSVPVGAIVGGVIAGLALICAVIFALAVCRRRRRLRGIQPDAYAKEDGRPDLLASTAPHARRVSLQRYHALESTSEPSTASGSALLRPADRTGALPTSSTSPSPSSSPSHPPELHSTRPPDARARVVGTRKAEKASYHTDLREDGGGIGPSGSSQSPQSSPPPPAHPMFDDGDDLAPSEAPPAYAP